MLWSLHIWALLEDCAPNPRPFSKNPENAPAYQELRVLTQCGFQTQTIHFSTEVISSAPVTLKRLGHNAAQ